MFFRKKSRYLTEYTGTSADIAEYNYINNMTIMRIDTAHYVWFGSMLAAGAVMGLGAKECPILVSGSIMLMIPFILSIAFQLRYICQLRTFVAVYFNSKLSLSYDRSGTFTKWAGYILLIPYLVYSGMCLIMALNQTVPLNSLLNMEFQLLKTTLFGRAVGSIFIVWGITNVFFLISAKILIGSSGQKIWKHYHDQWEIRKRQEEIEDFKSKCILT